MGKAATGAGIETAATHAPNSKQPARKQASLLDGDARRQIVPKPHGQSENTAFSRKGFVASRRAFDGVSVTFHRAPRFPVILRKPVYCGIMPRMRVHLNLWCLPAVEPDKRGCPMQFDIESIRFRGEPAYAEALRKMPGIEALSAKVFTNSAYIRRTLLASRLSIPESAAPDIYRTARELTRRFGINAPVELYQAASAENALIHFSVTPLLLEVRGHLPALLDKEAMAALLGRGIGHCLAHGANNPYR
ncbi:MAG: hypothetical protein LBD06_03225, partial [Candidatus Accumulibacter sp.]|nr:hypothetical protein [Accumulibacter sp.]